MRTNAPPVWSTVRCAPLPAERTSWNKPHDLATKYSHPQPLVDCLCASMDEETLEAFLAADNDIPKTALQANPLKASAEQVAAALDASGDRR